MVSGLDINPKKFGMRLKLARIPANLSVADVAKKLGDVGYKVGGVTEKTVWYWERGQLEEVTMGMIEAVSKITGQKETYFLGLTPLDESVARFKPREGWAQPQDLVLCSA